MTNRERVLIVDDDRAHAATLVRELGNRGFECKAADSGRAALAEIDRAPFDLLVTSLTLLDMEGRELCAKVRGRRPGLPVVLLAPYGSIDAAIAATADGVEDFVPKPVRQDELAFRLRRVFDGRRLEARCEELEARLAHVEREDRMLGTSAPMAAMRREIARVATSDAPVLVRGGSGAGKHLAAEAIHAASPRSRGPLVTVACALRPPAVLDAELFGFEADARPGTERPSAGRLEAAEGGTLLLEEIGAAPADLQAKLVRLLRERTAARAGGGAERRVDVRVVATTDEDLAARVAQGEFRADLYEALREHTVVVPPLRERGDDIVLLARAFARAAGRRHGRPIESLAAGAIERLQQHDWPGHVRELRGVVERAVLLGAGPVLEGEQLRLPVRAGAAHTNGRNGEGSTLVSRLLNSEIPFEDFEKEILIRALQRTRGNQTRAARLLGMTRRTLQYRIDKFDIDCEPMRH